jgi:hypothetical protein
VIFDLKSGKRRRLVQVVFGMLAAIFVISFVGFGIGSNAAGGLFDALGIGGSSSGSTDTGYDQQIEDAQNKVDADPSNERALLDLVNYHYLAGTQNGIETDPQTGQTTISEDAHSQLEDAVAAWQDYLHTKPAKPEAAAAASAAQAYSFLADFSGAAEAQRIVAEDGNSAAAFGQLALYLYQDLKLEAGDAAGQQAVKAADPSQRQQIQKQMDNLADAARKYAKQVKQQAQQGGQQAGEQQLQNPFGGLGGGTTAPPPTP